MAKRRLRVLLAEKRLSETGIILRSIGAGVGWALEMLFVRTKETVQEALGAYHPDLALLDLALLQPDAALCTYGLHLQNHQTPLIVFGETSEKTCAEECLSSGARDYLLEGFMDDRTVRRMLQTAVAAMENKECWNEGCSNTGETWRYSAQTEAAEDMEHPSMTPVPARKQEELVQMRKRKVRTSDRVVPRRSGRNRIGTQQCQRGMSWNSRSSIANPNESMQRRTIPARSVPDHGDRGEWRRGFTTAGVQWSRIPARDWGTAMKAVSQKNCEVTSAGNGLVRVLLLEESLADSQDILEELRAAGMNIEPTVLATRQEFVDAITSQNFSAVRKALGETQLRALNDEVQRALQKSEERNRQLVENSVYGVFRILPDGKFVFANPSLLEILACATLEVLQTLNFTTDIFRFPEHCAKLMNSCRKDGLVHNAETEWRRKDGGLLSVKLHLRYLSVPGQADQIEGIVEDVTELRSLEHQLLQAQKFETIGQLASAVAHDFNNVVGAILGWAELGYEESVALPRVAERFARIGEQVDRAASRTRELLAFARCQELQSLPVDLNTIIRNLASFLDKAIGRDIEMRVAPGVLKPIQADPVQIGQVLMNLCLNAQDATEMERIDEAFCRYYPCVIPGRYAVLAVSDTGIGMTPEIRERIFEPFLTTKERGTGTGMGLATAYGLVKQHGGFIYVDSEPWQGSLFRVYLPVCDRTTEGPGPKFELLEMSHASNWRVPEPFC